MKTKTYADHSRGANAKTAATNSTKATTYSAASAQADGNNIRKHTGVWDMKNKTMQ